MKHEGFIRHAGFRWLWVAVVLNGAAIASYVWLADPKPDGGTAYGYVMGTVGAGLILWLTCLGLRKRTFNDGRWSLKAWVSAHVYLGLSLIVIATLHSGFQFGWNIHTVAYGLMMLVIASGLFGVVAYVVLPRRLSENRKQATEKQMLENIRSLDRQIHDAAQPLGNKATAIVRLSLEQTDIAGGFWRALLGWHGSCGNARAMRRLRKVRRKEKNTSALDQVKTLMTQKAEALAQARRHVQIRAILECWLYIHVPATFALLAALTAHIVSVFFYS